MDIVGMFSNTISIQSGPNTIKLLGTHTHTIRWQSTNCQVAAPAIIGKEKIGGKRLQSTGCMLWCKCIGNGCCHIMRQWHPKQWHHQGEKNKAKVAIPMVLTIKTYVFFMECTTLFGTCPLMVSNGSIHIQFNPFTTEWDLLAPCGSVHQSLWTNHWPWGCCAFLLPGALPLWLVVYAAHSNST